MARCSLPGMSLAVPRGSVGHCRAEAATAGPGTCVGWRVHSRLPQTGLVSWRSVPAAPSSPLACHGERVAEAA